MTTRTAALAFALALGAALGVHGCADDRASIQIQAVCYPTGDCTFGGRCDAQFIGFPTLDTATSTTDRLWLFLQVENQLPNNEDLGSGRLNTNDAHIDETTIEYEGPALPAVAIGSNFSVPASSTSVVSVDVIPETVGDLLPKGSNYELVAKIRFRGYYDDDTRFETGEFPITVRICESCVEPRCAVGTCPPGSEGQLPLECVE